MWPSFTTLTINLRLSEKSPNAKGGKDNYHLAILDSS